MIRPAYVFLSVLASAAVVIGLGAVVGPSQAVVEKQPGREESISSLQLVCPYVGGQAGGTSTVSAMALPAAAAPSVGSVASKDAPAPVTVTPLTGVQAAAAPVAQVEARGTLGALTPQVVDPTGFTVGTVGALAPGLVAEQSMLVSSPDVRGLSGTSCTAPDRDAWFVGASGQVGHRARLVLGNPSDVPAVVDVHVWDDKGPVQTPAAEDLAVPARASKTLLLDALAPDSARLALQVVTKTGMVSSAVEVRESSTSDALGASWLPQTSPATQLLIPGVAGDGERTLQVAAPGDSDAIVKVRFLGPDGPFSPVDTDVLTVAGGTVTELPLAAGDAPVAVVLDSDTKVVAGVREVRKGASGLPDIAYTAAVPALGSVGATLGARTTKGFATSLILSAAGRQPVKVTVSIVDAAGTVVGTQEVDVPAQSTKVFGVPEQAGPVAVVVRPDKAGALVAARQVTGSDSAGAFLDVQPMTEAPVTVRVPDVAADLITGIN